MFGISGATAHALTSQSRRFRAESMKSRILFSVAMLFWGGLTWALYLAFAAWLGPFPE